METYRVLITIRFLARVLKEGVQFWYNDTSTVQRYISPEFGRPKASIFCSRGVPGRLDALLAKSLITICLNQSIYSAYEKVHHAIFRIFVIISNFSLL